MPASTAGTPQVDLDAGALAKDSIKKLKITHARPQLEVLRGK